MITAGKAEARRLAASTPRKFWVVWWNFAASLGVPGNVGGATVDGKPWPYAPRVILRRALERAGARGMTLQVGAEPEYFLVRRGPDGGIQDTNGNFGTPMSGVITVLPDDD